MYELYGVGLVHVLRSFPPKLNLVQNRVVLGVVVAISVPYSPESGGMTAENEALWLFPLDLEQ